MTTPPDIGDRLRRLPEDVLLFARAAAALAKEHGTQAVLVGGVVRDLLLDRAVVDADVMVEPPVEPVVQALAKRFSAALVSHPRFRTFRLDVPGGRKFDIVTAREERYEAPAALPDVVPSTFEKDLARRDFSINAMICRVEPKGETLHDPLGGLDDIRRKSVRALHKNSFVDDPTRLFRAARFAARLQFMVDAETEAWILASMASGVPDRLSPVRRRHEMDLILKEERATPALEILKRWKALRYLHAAWNDLDLGAANVDGVSGDGKDRFAGRWAALFQPLGAVAATAAMTSLSFEKATKRSVLDKLIIG